MNIKFLNARAFWIKIALLVIFSLAYLPLASLKESAPFEIYLAVLIAIHVYFFVVLLSKVAWRELKNNRKTLVARIVAIALLSLALVWLGKSPLRAELVIFLSFSFALHVLLVSALHLRIVLPKKIYHKSSVRS